MKAIKFFVFALAFAFVSSAAFSSTVTFTQGNWQISMNDDFTEITIQGIIDCPYQSDVVIPDNFDGIPVTAIARRAFYDRSMKSVVIPESVKEIGSEAFYYCTALEKISIPGGILVIPENAFGYCRMLSEVVIPNSVKEIGNCDFQGCGCLSKITVPDSVEKIGYSAFAYCSGLESAVIYSAERIESYVFSECPKLETVVLPKNLKSIWEKAFSGCKVLKELTIPQSVTSVGRNVFSGCSAITLLYKISVAKKYNTDVF